jgi:hypothetical protein
MPKNLCIHIEDIKTVIRLSKTQKASFQMQLNENRRLTFKSFEEQSELSGETLVAQVQTKKGDNLENWQK